jgi:hypothetical protein
MRATIGIEKDGSSPQLTSPRRKFQLADAMILVAGTAIGWGWMMSIARVEKCSPYDWFRSVFAPEPWYDLYAHSYRITSLAMLTIPLVATMSLALLPIRLIGARPRFRSSTRQPGIIASCASGLAIAFIALPLLIGAVAGGLGRAGLPEMLVDEEGLLSMTMYGGLAVLVSWMTLFVGGRWRAEAGWVDRLGRSLGLYWILAALAVWAACFLEETTVFPFRMRIFPSESLIVAFGEATLKLGTISMPVIALVTLTLLPIRLFRRRPKVRQLARQPGLMASCASSLAMVLVGLQVAFALLLIAVVDDDGVSWQELIRMLPDWLLSKETVTQLSRCGGLAVLVSWMTLVVGGQWRATRSRVERLGRAIGVCWILAAFAIATVDALIQADLVRQYAETFKTSWRNPQSPPGEPEKAKPHDELVLSKSVRTK